MAMSCANSRALSLSSSTPAEALRCALPTHTHTHKQRQWRRALSQAFIRVVVYYARRLCLCRLSHLRVSLLGKRVCCPPPLPHSLTHTPSLVCLYVCAARFGISFAGAAAVSLHSFVCSRALQFEQEFQCVEKPLKQFNKKTTTIATTR